MLDQHDVELFVLELSSFQLETTQSLQPQVGAVLNISADHLDRHGDVDNYAQIKAQIYSNAKVSVINCDDDYVSNMQTSGQVISFGLGKPKENHFGLLNKNGEIHLAFGENHLMPASEIALQGEAGILNSLAALAIGQALTLPMQDMLKVLKSFKGLPHRLALVAESNGVSWYNDSKGTNIGATVSSLRSLEENIILIAGGIFKGGDLELFNQTVSKHAKHVILLGQDAALLHQSLEPSIAMDYANSMQQAVETAKNKATSGDKILLSPACASFDMYTNYIERGKDFEQCVKRILS